MIFVFGSNLSGIHGAGAAATAYRHHGATWGQGEGPQGNSYAIPTKNHDVRSPLPPHLVLFFVNKFLTYAHIQSAIDFQVTRIGCGFAGFKDKDIAPMFQKAPHNCLFDEAWLQLMPAGTRFWGTF